MVELTSMGCIYKYFLLCGGYYVQYLKEVVRNAKVYIRPLQNDLPIEIIQPDLFDQVHIIVPTVVQYLL